MLTYHSQQSCHVAETEGRGTTVLRCVPPRIVKSQSRRYRDVVAGITWREHEKEFSTLNIAQNSFGRYQKPLVWAAPDGHGKRSSSFVFWRRAPYMIIFAIHSLNFSHNSPELGDELHLLQLSTSRARRTPPKSCTIVAGACVTRLIGVGA